MSGAAPAKLLRPLARARALSMRAAFVRVLRASLAQHGVSHDMLAECCGRTRQRVTEWCDEHAGDDGPVPNVLDELAFPPAVRADLDAWRATHRLCVLVPAAPDGLEHGERLALLATALTAPVSSYAVALADDHVSASERADLCPKLDRAVGVAAAASLALKAAAR